MAQLVVFAPAPSVPMPKKMPRKAPAPLHVLPLPPEDDAGFEAGHGVWARGVGTGSGAGVRGVWARRLFGADGDVKLLDSDNMEAGQKSVKTEPLDCERREEIAHRLWSAQRAAKNGAGGTVKTEMKDESIAA